MWMNKDQQFFDPNRRPSTIMLSTLRKTYFLLCVTGEFSRASEGGHRREAWVLAQNYAHIR